MGNQPLLTIAIPTYNRSTFLAETLQQLQLEMVRCSPCNIEIIVSDNASNDDTTLIVNAFNESGFLIKYVLNSENIGSDRNIAQCFNLATGQYVLILGDDDLFVDGALDILVKELEIKRNGVACMRPYGFDHNFRVEYPGDVGSNRTYKKAGDFLITIGPLVTLISSCVINKGLLIGVDANDYCGENLVQVHLVFQAAIKAEQNVFISRYMIGCKRNNSGGYNFSKVFVENLGNIFDQYVGESFTRKNVSAIESRLIKSYFPFYLLKQRLNNQGDWQSTFEQFNKRYHGRFVFYIWLFPIFKLPRLLGVLWAGLATVIGRLINDDWLRGLKFAINKII